ncbi:hypothetical protein EVJ50_06275 [Synechococcus sp. RSCCF101]|uniref:hypothetical protein n=1 Tax=Synechococcus sp. RSCCF101 TaxID=2511069 RepID=UPI0012446A29|nr:hypothetical protein [Synechococcus sp. RSCCF101]QEY31907.1 hypothetical protein EVJ50_06275 [Synechococcus sp. RSCCF101]
MSAHQAKLDAIELMIRDLQTRHEEIRHRAAFRGCSAELRILQEELLAYLHSKRQGLSEAGAAAAENPADS